MRRPVSVPPVRMMQSTSGLAVSTGPTSAPEQGTNCRVLRLTPARQKHWQSTQAVSTASEAGLKMTVLPAARAATMPPQGMAMGKFQGEMTRATPRPRTSRFGLRSYSRTACG